MSTTISGIRWRHRTKSSPLRPPDGLNLSAIGCLYTLVAQLKAEAAKRSLPYQTLIRMWLKEKLDTLGQAGPRKASDLKG